MTRAPLTTIIAMLVLSAVSLQFTAAQQTKPDTYAHVRGRVTDFGGAVIPGFTIIFQSQSGKWKISSGDSGEYQLSVPAGVYEVGDESPNFSFRRAPLELKPGAVTVVNVVPVPEAVSYGSTAPTYYYDSFPPPAGGNARLSLLIRYRRKSVGRARTNYENCVVSQNTVTLYAERVTLDRSTLVFRATGSVLIEDGSKRELLGAAEMDFTNGVAQIRRQWLPAK